jgi:hypothetical protein
MDLEARPGRVLAGADRAEEHLAVGPEAGARAAEDVARHRGRAVAGSGEMPPHAAVLGRKKVVASAKVIAFAAREKAQMSTLGYHGRFASS